MTSRADTSSTRTKGRRLHWLDVAVVALAIAVLGYFAYRVQSALIYNWDWGTIVPFIARFDDESGSWVTGLLIQGLITTIRLALWGIVVAGVIGFLMGLCRTASNLFLRIVARVYVDFVRNMPPLVFIFFFYFFLSNQIAPLLGLDDLTLNASATTTSIITVLFGEPKLFANFISGLVCLALFEGAYITEVVRAGIQSIPKGQWEAGDSVGLTKTQVMRNVIAPQALRRILPPLANQFITLIKNSSIVSLISIQELTFMTVEVGVSTTRVFEVWITCAVLYFLVCYGCATAFKMLETRPHRS